jgi:endoglucanase Acf2
MRKQGDYITWGYHELAWSIRSSQFFNSIYDAQGNEIQRFQNTKKAGAVKVKEGAKWVLMRYRTNKGYPKYRLLQIYENGEMWMYTSFNERTTLDEIEKLNIPEKLKKVLIQEILEW